MIFYTVNPKYDLKVIPLESWVIFFNIVCFSRLLEFFVLIHASRLFQKMIRASLGSMPENAALFEIPVHINGSKL